MFVPTVKTTKTTFALILFVTIIFVLTSCVTEYQPYKPFVYKTNINIEGKYTPEEEKVIQSELEQQLHDSIRVRRVRKFLVMKVLKKPAVYDSLNVDISVRYMSAMLHSLGYYRDSINHNFSVDTAGDQYRTTINFNVFPGKLFRIDSLDYRLTDSVAHHPSIDTLQQLLLHSASNAVIHKGDPFSKYLMSSELDRLADLARNNGYLLFTREQLWAVWDTVGRSVLSASTDISEQLRVLEELKRRRENPGSDLQITLKPNFDTNSLRRYYVGQVRIYPDTDVDTMENRFYPPKITTLTRNRYEFITYHNLFKPRKLIHFIYLRRGELYTQSNYLKTQNRFGLPAWRLTSVIQLPRPGTDTVDFEIRLVPAKKYHAAVVFDVSKNQGNLVNAEGNLLGLGGNLNFLNRNFAKSASLATTNFRYGIELTSRIDSIQTQQAIISHTIQFPRMVPRLTTLVSQKWRENAQTFLSTNIAFTDRIAYYRVFTVNTSLGWEFSADKSIIGFRFPNIEYNSLQKRPQLIDLIAKNRSYQYIFNDGFIISGLVNWNKTGGRNYLTTSRKVSVELAGLPGFLQYIFPGTKFYHFVKLDGEYSAYLKTGARKRSTLAGRVFAGYGYGIPMGNKDGKIDSTNYFMPFFRQYYAGGPSSMRAWALRKLGPGSSIKSFDRTEAPDRFGDVRLEMNLEYRIFLTKFLGVYPLETAVFTDIGNVWFRRPNADFPNGEFRLDRLGKDIAVGVGTGIRIDFSFLLLRMDLAWKAKNPSPDLSDDNGQNKWFYHTRPWIGDKTNIITGFTRYGAQFQLGINYPF
jgi:outer membrane protein insertion porin family